MPYCFIEENESSYVGGYHLFNPPERNLLDSNQGAVSRLKKRQLM